MHSVATKYAPLEADDQLKCWLQFYALKATIELLGLPLHNNSIDIIQAQKTSSNAASLRKAIKAKDSLILTNQRMVIDFATKYKNDRLSETELIQIANEGLCTALWKYDPFKKSKNKASKFSSYAWFWIKALVFEALYKIDPIYIPAHVRKELTEYNYSYVSKEEIEETIGGVSNDEAPTSSTLNEVMGLLSIEQQDLLIDAFGLDNDSSYLTVAVLNGWSFEETVAKVDEAISAIKQNK